MLAKPNLSHTLVRYGAAVVITLAAAAVRWALQPAVGAASPYMTFYLAVVASAAFAGLGPGLAATVLGGLLGVGLAAGPLEQLQLSNRAEQLRLFVYLLSGLGISLIAGSMHEARRRANAEAEQLRRATEELRVANERLLEADRGKDRFLAVLAHELRNPLMPIKHCLYLLEHSASDSDTARRARAIMARQTDQMARLVNDLLDVTRISHDKLDLQRTSTDLRDVVGRAMDDHRALFIERGVGLHERKPDKPLMVYGDASRLAQVLGNLLNNALKFTQRGGHVYVDLEQRGNDAAVRVRDTGVGIPTDMVARIFEPFIQAEQKLERTAGGLGLGLTLVKRLVELHGGSVKARSDGPGHGAEFTIRLPLDTKPPVPDRLPDSGHPAHVRRRVLLVEDDLDSAQVLSQLLQSEGHEVDVCHSGMEAIEKAPDWQPDAVLCDIGLPGMDGYDVARALREDPRLKGATLIALTGYATPESREKALSAGFHKHLVKPSSAEELDEVLSEEASGSRT